MAEATLEAPSEKGRAAARFAALYAEREPFLQRARRLALLTEYTLFREMGANGTTNERLPWQSLGAYGVNNLSAKLVLAMFPPGITCVNLKPSRKVVQGMRAQYDADTAGKLRAIIDKGLAGQEQEFTDCCEEDGDRAVHFDALRHLIVGGNHGIHLCDDGSLQSIRFERYVVVRDRMGNLLEFVVQLPLTYETMDPDVQAIARRHGYGPWEEDPENPGTKTDKRWTQGSNRNPIWDPVMVYTHGRLRNGRWEVYDEVFSEEVPGSRALYKKDELPWLFLRMITLEGEAYGRSYVESYEADLQTYDGNWQVLTEGGAIIAKSYIMVKPGSSTSKATIEQANNGDVITGEEGDVSFVRSDKGGDLAFVVNQTKQIEQRLEKIFMIFAPRQGERVTKEEIQLTAQALDATLGGVYSNQVVTYQKPLVELKMRRLEKHGRIDKLPEGMVKVTILTGVAALGRDQKAAQLEQYIEFWMKTLTPQFVAPYLNVETALLRSAANRSIDSDGLVKSEEEVQASQQQQQQEALAANVAPNLVDAGGKMMAQQQQQQADQQAAQQGQQQ